MAQDPSIAAPVDEELQERPGFASRRWRLGRQSGAAALGLSLWELLPGQAAYPFHAHYVEEEMAIVLCGRPWLRSYDGWRELEEGEVVAFPVGDRGAHQLLNRSAEPVRFLALSTGGTADVVIYPDSDKVAAVERRADGGGVRELHRRSDAVGYWDGELPPEPSG